MKVERTVIAGSLESNDVLITLRPSEEKEVKIVIESIVKKQFLGRIENAVKEVLDKFDVENACIYVQDKGALDCTLKARMETAVLRSKERN